jgi:DNA-binding CsgD family transcriptional regulator
VLVTIRAAVGQEACEQARSEGRAVSLEEAVAYARRARGRHSRSVSGWDSLTPTEVRVVSLVARHLTNAEIADQLFVSTLTVKSHLTRVFAKLGVADRRQLAETATVHLSPGDT